MRAAVFCDDGQVRVASGLTTVLLEVIRDEHRVSIVLDKRTAKVLALLLAQEGGS